MFSLFYTEMTTFRTKKGDLILMHHPKKTLIQFYEWLYQKTLQIKHFLQIRLFYRLPIMSSEKTIRYILKHKCSIARYGDGEFSIMMGSYDIDFQSRSTELSKKLLDVLSHANKNLLICIPRYFNSVRKCNTNVKKFWLKWGMNNNRQINLSKTLRHHCGRSYKYGDSLITRPYMDLKSKKSADRIFPLLKALWINRDLLIVEGIETRLGVGNDLFSGANSISRILAPARNAFDCYDKILDAVLKNWNGQLVLLALGPTATVMAAELSSHGIQALDIGHIDIEYEWYLQKATKKIQIVGKFTNEVCPSATIDPCNDLHYLKQIIHTCNISNSQ